MDLAQLYNVGRAAIRTTLARLEQDGLVERESNRGARVRAISAAALKAKASGQRVFRGRVGVQFARTL